MIRTGYEDHRVAKKSLANERQSRGVVRPARQGKKPRQKSAQLQKQTKHGR
jgi:hypothetical protein